MKNQNTALIVRLGVTLFVLTAVAAALLAGVNSITKDKIAAATAEKRANAMSIVLPDSTPGGSTTTENGITVTAMLKDGVVDGYCAEVAPSGFGGAISMVVGIKVDEDGARRITGVSILSMSETPGLGTRAAEPDFTNQYVGLTNAITLGSGDNSIDALTGATVTSKAVTLGVNTALDALTDAVIEEVTQ